MSGVRVLVGTRKGAFVITGDAKRQKWDVSGPHFAGWEIYHMQGAPSDPNRIYASQSSGWFGQLIQRSDDGGQTWTPMDNKFLYEGEVGTHLWYDGTSHPWEFKRIWALEPSPIDPDLVYAGAEDAAIFRSQDGGKSWEELRGLRGHETGKFWTPGAGGMCLHTILLDANHPERIYIAISAAGAFRSDDAGDTWKPINRGLRSDQIPQPDAEVGHCVHCIAMHPSRPDVLFMQKHWDIMRSDNRGDQWREVSGDLPTDFGFPIEVHTHEPETIYIAPIKSDSEHFPIDGKLRIYRSRTGGNDWEALTNGLPQENCYVNVLRSAMAVDKLDSCGVYFGTTGGAVYCSPDSGDHWAPIVHDLPAVLSVEVNARMIRVVLPFHLKNLAQITGEVTLDVPPPVTQKAVIDALEKAYPVLEGVIRDRLTQKRRPLLRYYACERDLSHEPENDPLPDAVANGHEPFLVIGSMAGG